MRSNTPLTLILLASIGCTPIQEAQTDTDSITDRTVDPTETDDPTTLTDTDTRITTFAGGMYRMGALDLLPDDDTDGDGTVDNNLVNALDLVDILLPMTDLSLATFNATINAGMASANIILLDFWVTNGENMSVGILYAEENNENMRVDPDSVDANGNALITLVGAFTDQVNYAAGPGEINFPAQLIADTDTSLVTIKEAELSGEIDETISNGRLQGVLPIRSIIDDVIAPLIPPEGFDVDGDGINETPAEILALIEDLAPLVADVTLPDGTDGVTCTFAYYALPITL